MLKNLLSLEKDYLFWGIVYVPFILLLVNFYISDLSAWDMQGHVIAAKKFKDSIFPFLSGWNKSHFAGYPQGFLYPSLFHWFIGGFAKIIDLDFSFRFFVSLSIVLMPVAWFYCFEKHGLSKEKIKIAMILQILLYFAPKNSMGGDVFGTFLIGLVNQQWAMAFFYLYLGSISKIHEKKYWILAGLFLGIICLSHAFVLFAAILATLAYFFAYKDFRTLNHLKPWFKMIILSLMIGAVWWVPYLKYRSWGAGLGLPFITQLHLWGNEQWGLILVVCISLLVSYALFCLFKNRSNLKNLTNFTAPMYFLISILTLVIIIAAVSLLTDFPVYDYFPIHLYRLQFFVLSILFFLISFKLENKVSIWLLYVITFASCVYGINFSTVTKKAEFNLGFRFNPESRVLVYQGPKSLFDFYLPHKLADTINLNNYSTFNGLFVESSKHSGLYMSLLHGMFKYPVSWGVKILPFNTLLVRDQLNALGVNSIVTKTPLSGENRFNLPIKDMVENIRAEIFYNDKEKVELFHSYNLDNPFAETIHDFSFTKKDWGQEVFHWWTSITKIQTTLIYGDQNHLTERSGISAAKKLRVVRGSDEKFEVFADPTPHWIKIKESYFPLWKAFSNNKEIPVYLCTPYMMCVYGSGLIEFRFTRSTTEIISYLLTIIGILFCLFSFRSKWFHVVTGIGLLITSSGLSAKSTFDSNLVKADSIATGSYHTCIKREKNVFCWGYNQFSQLGDKTQETRLVKTKAQHSLSDVKGLSLGSYHTCIWNDRDVQCVGNNYDQQFGFKSDQLFIRDFISVSDFFFQNQHLILDVQSFGTNLCIFSIDKSNNHHLHCAGGTWKRFGFKFHYPLNETIQSLSLGENHLCYIQNEAVYCAGSSKFGATTLSVDSFERFVKIKGIDEKKLPARKVSAGAVHSCGVFYDLSKKKDGIYCWGDNSISQLGKDNQLRPSVFHAPQFLDSLAPAVLDKVDIVRAGYAHTCAVISKQLYCWGSNLKKESAPIKQKLEYPHYIKRVPFFNVDDVYLGVHYTCAMNKNHFSCFGVQGNGFQRKLD